MSRIQDILDKAGREGTVRRTRALVDEYAPPPPPADDVRGRGATELPPPPRARTADTTPRPLGAPPPVAHPPPPIAARPAAEPPPAWAYEPAPVAAVDVPIEIAGPESLDESRAASTGLDQHLVAALAPTSLAAEQYRALRTRLKRAENGRTVRVIAITSPAKGDGKSLTAANLALTMAQEFPQRVLLLDADLRRPTVHHLFGLAEGPGLSEVLMSVADLDQAVVTLPDHHLSILPAGFPPGRPAELLGSNAMRRLLETLRGRFDRVLLDVPPVEPLADFHILAPMIDGLLMIVRAGVTPRPAIERALAGLDASKVLGLVLNESGDSTAKDDEADYGYIGG